MQINISFRKLYLVIKPKFSAKNFFSKSSEIVKIDDNTVCEDIHHRCWNYLTCCSTNIGEYYIHGINEMNNVRSPVLLNPYCVIQRQKQHSFPVYILQKPKYSTHTDKSVITFLKIGSADKNKSFSNIIRNRIGDPPGTNLNTTNVSQHLIFLFFSF